jgi:hypothetical protein
MVWNLVAIGAIGFLLGLTFRAGALVGATLLTAIVAVAIKLGTDASGVEIFLFTLELVVVLQFAYLVGLGFCLWWRR